MGYPEIGRYVEFIDEHSRSRDALVTAVHDNGQKREQLPAVNLIVVALDESQHDQYGRQIERPCSVSADGPHAAHGRFYRLK